MQTDILSDTLTRIRNAQRVMLSHVDCCLSSLVVAVLKVLQEEGYIKSYEIVKKLGAKYPDQYLYLLTYIDLQLTPLLM